MAIAFSGLLVRVQIAVLRGQLGTVTVVQEQAHADLRVVAIQRALIWRGRYEMPLRMNSEVLAVQQMLFGFGDWRTPDGGNVMGLDIGSDSLSLPSGRYGLRGLGLNIANGRLQKTYCADHLLRATIKLEASYRLFAANGRELSRPLEQ